MERFRSNHIHILEVSQSSEPSQKQSRCQEVKISVHRCAPSNLKELDLFLQRTVINFNLYTEEISQSPSKKPCCCKCSEICFN